MGSPGTLGRNGAALPRPDASIIFVHPYQRERNGHLEWVSGYSRSGPLGLLGFPSLSDIADKILGVSRANAQTLEEEPAEEGELWNFNQALEQYSSSLGRPLTEEELGAIREGRIRITNRDLTENDIRLVDQWRLALEYLDRIDPQPTGRFSFVNPGSVPTEQEVQNLWSQAYDIREFLGIRDPWRPGETYLDRFLRGNAFDHLRKDAYDYNEIYVDKLGGGYCRLDGYNRYEIVSRKDTQLFHITETAAERYFKEFINKYYTGAQISFVESNIIQGIAGLKLKDQYILEVPVQDKPVPNSIL